MGKVYVPALKIHKTIKDPIHGYIPLTELEYEIIQLPVFNRLHSLKQLSMAYLVFPGATTTRFIHSLGAMFLASKVIYQLLQSVDDVIFKELFPKATTDEKRMGIIQTVRLAALIHDIGHGPFSHAAEDVMRACLEEIHEDEFIHAQQLLGGDPAHLPVHEYYSYKLAKSVLSDLIRKPSLRKTDDGTTIPLDVRDIVSLIVKKEAPRSEFCTENGLSILRKIISSQLDADRMDYLVRDAYVSGVPYGAVDVERIIMNMFIRKDNAGEYEIAIHERALASIEDMLDARFKMYKWLVSHHMVVAANELLKQAIVYLVEDKKIHMQDFYWETFAQGQITDSYIMDKIISELNSGTNDFKGLFDRRYLPVSLLKRPQEHKSFQIRVEKILGKDLEKETFQEKINKFFQAINKSPIIKVKGTNVRLFLTAMPRSPYKAMSPHDKVYISSDRIDQLTPLTKISEYFASINNEWTTFPSYFVSYIVSGKTKKESAKFRNAVLNQVAQQISGIK